MLNSWLAHEPFKYLPEPAKEELNRVAEIQTYPKGTVIFKERQSADFLWVLQEGWIQLGKHTADGKTLTIDLVTATHGRVLRKCFRSGGTADRLRPAQAR